METVHDITKKISFFEVAFQYMVYYLSGSVDLIKAKRRPKDIPKIFNSIRWSARDAGLPTMCANNLKIQSLAVDSIGTSETKD